MSQSENTRHVYFLLSCLTGTRKTSQPRLANESTINTTSDSITTVAQIEGTRILEPMQRGYTEHLDDMADTDHKYSNSCYHLLI